MIKKEKLIFVLSEIKTDEFAVFPENLNQDNSKEEINLQIQFSYGISDRDQKFMVSLKYIFSLKDKNIIAIKGSCFFDINKKAWNKLIKNDVIIFPENQVLNMTSMAIGTIRGILHAKTESTPFNKYYIPQADVSSMIAMDIEIPILENS